MEFVRSVYKRATEPKKESPDIVEKIKHRVRKELLRRTITIYVDLHSSDDLHPKPLPTEEEEPNMAKNIVVVEAGRIGVCNFEADVHNPEQQRSNIIYLSNIYDRARKLTIAKANQEYFSTLKPDKFEQVQHNQLLLNAYGIPKDAFVEHVLPEYQFRAQNQVFDQSYRSYLSNKRWGTSGDVEEAGNYFMGVYIIEFHNTTDEEYETFRNAYEDGMMDVSWKPPDHLLRRKLRLGFESLQKLNLMNVEVSQMLCRKLRKPDMPFGFGTSISSSTTGIDRYNRTDLVHILKYFFNLGFEYVNIIDQGCRYLKVDYNDPEAIKSGFTLARQHSAAEKEAVKQIPYGLLRKRTRTSYKRKYKPTKRLQKRVDKTRKSHSPLPK